MPLKILGTGQGYLKAGFLGFQGSGKTYTAILLAAAVRKAFKLSGPIAMIDTENATEYVAPLVEAITGQKLVGDRTRDFEQLCSLAGECEREGISVLVADSMTHFWRSVCKAYLDGVNANRVANNQRPRNRLEFQDWNPIKEQWAKWTEWYLNSRMHVIVCGRAGYEYDMQKDEETHRSELVKTGIKMKTEGEFGFEPSLLVQMELEQVPDPNGPGGFRQVRIASVLKDRFGVTDGYSFTFVRGESREAEMESVLKAFGPHLNMLKPGSHSAVSMSQSPMPVDDEGNIDWNRERKARTILCEEIQGLLVARWPGQSAEEKKQKADAIYRTFNTRSWTAVESFNSAVLREGLAKMRTEAGEKETPIAPAVADDNPELSPAIPPPAAVPLEKQAEDPKGPSPLQAGGYNPCKFMRLLANEKKVKEGEVLGAIKELGMVDKQYWTFEELLLADGRVFDKLHREIADVVAKIVKAKEGK